MTDSPAQPIYRDHNNGKDIAELVIDADPETGAVAAHQVNRTQTAYDRMLQAKLIMKHQWRAAHDLDQLWQRARPIPGVHAANLDKGQAGNGNHDIDPEADRKLRHYARALGTARWRYIQRLVYDNAVPHRHDWAATRGALQQLAREMGLA